MKTVWLDELPPYPVRSFTYRNEQARADDVQTVIMYKLNRYLHSRRLRVASGAATSGHAQEQAPRFRPKVVLMSLSSFSSKLEMLIHAPFKILQGQIRSVVLGRLLYRVWLMYYFH
jgi:hypothetical protein